MDKDRCKILMRYLLKNGKNKMDGTAQNDV